MNILYLLKILDTKKLSVLVENMDMPLIDINLAIWDAEKAGEVKVDMDKDTIKALKKPEITFNADLSSKLLRVMQRYESKEKNINRGKLNSWIKDPETGLGYPYHEYLMALHYLIDSGQIETEIVSVPEIKGKRPFHRFVFLQFPDNPNEDWNRNEVNKWIANWNKKK